jgi:NCS2 family nucleobase:cation symporter-2
MPKNTPSAAELRNPDFVPPMQMSLALGLQHVLAMFVSNFTPAIIISGAAGFILGGADAIFLIQMSMLFAGIATLMQTIGFGPVGSRLPVMQGTSFAFIPVMIPALKTAGISGLFGAIFIGGLFHACLGFFIQRLRHWFPPLVSGLVILVIGIELIPVGIMYAAGGAADFEVSASWWGNSIHWGMALIVIIVALGLNFWTKGILSSAAILFGLIAGYVVGILLGEVDFSVVANADWLAIPQPFKYGIDFNLAAIIGICLMSIVSAIETVGDISAITKSGANREATDKELSGGTFADGLGTAVASIFGGLPNTSFSQNVGLISMTGVMSRTVVTLGAIFLIICGLIPKVGAIVASMPIAVLGGGVIVMFGMVASAGVNMLAGVKWSRRNMMVLALSLAFGLGLHNVPEALQHLPETAQVILASGLLPAAFLAVVLNLILPQGK